jgi:RNA polymerase sigma factor (sigma-70 family)
VSDRNQLVEENLPLASHFVGLIAPHRADADDLLGAAYLGLIRAAELYRPELGFEFSTYASGWIRSHIQRAIQGADLIHVPTHLDREERAALRGRLAPASLDGVRTGPRGGEDVRAPEPAATEETDSAERRDEAALAVGMLERLPGRYREVVRLHVMEGLSLREVARRVGVSGERVRQLVRKGLGLLRQQGASKREGPAAA